MVAEMHSVPEREPSNARRPDRHRRALLASVLCAVIGVVALVVALTALFGWAWALLAMVPIFLYIAYLLAPEEN